MNPKLKTRLSIWGVLLVVATIFAIANDGLRQTWGMLLAFYILCPVVEIINYLVIKKRLK